MAGAAASGDVQAAAQGLRYRDFLTVALVIDGEDLFPDNWIYIHDPNVRVGRIQNFRSWSPWMVPDPSKASRRHGVLLLRRATSCGRWTTTRSSSSPSASSASSAWPTRPRSRRATSRASRKAYPMYDADYAERVDVDPRLARRASATCMQVGRNGLHRYNNSDHSMLTAMRAVENITNGHRARHLGGQRRVRVPRGGRRRTSTRTSARPRPAAMREPLADAPVS